MKTIICQLFLLKFNRDNNHEWKTIVNVKDEDVNNYKNNYKKNYINDKNPKNEKTKCDCCCTTWTTNTLIEKKLDRL